MRGKGLVIASRRGTPRGRPPRAASRAPAGGHKGRPYDAKEIPSRDALRALSLVTTGHSRSKNGVVSLAYDPVVHAEMRLGMDCRVIWHQDGASRLLPDNDEWRARSPHEHFVMAGLVTVTWP